MNEDKTAIKIVSGSFQMKCDMEFILFAELCIVSAASQESWAEVFSHVETVPGLDDRPACELTSLELAAVVDKILRKISEGHPTMHQSIIEKLFDLADMG